MTRHLLIGALAFTLFGFAVTPATKAWDDCGGYGLGYGWLYNSLRYEVPHFAAFPPVYYSHPVPRTYGYSPFAYPPHVMTPEIVGEVEPLEIVNPYVPSTQQPAAEEKTDQTVQNAREPQPLVIVNPFVSPNRAVAKQ
jgi:hypothetical protein